VARGHLRTAHPIQAFVPEVFIHFRMYRRWENRQGFSKCMNTSDVIYGVTLQGQGSNVDFTGMFMMRVGYV
jgi:hypothetical protein